MWGTSFTELAKQAEAAAAAAAQTASTTSTSSWFNLDALQQSDEQQQKAQEPDKPAPPSETPVSQVMPVVNFFGSAAESSTATTAPPPRPKGKLQVPAASAAKSSAVKTPEVPSTTTTSSSSTPESLAVVDEPHKPPAQIPEPVEKAEKKETPIVAAADQDGWDDEDDLGFADDDDNDEEEEGPKLPPPVPEESVPLQSQVEPNKTATNVTDAGAKPINEPDVVEKEPTSAEENLEPVEASSINGNAMDSTTTKATNENESGTQQTDEIKEKVGEEQSPSEQLPCDEKQVDTNNVETTEVQPKVDAKQIPEAAVETPDDGESTDEEGPQPLPQSESVAVEQPETNGLDKEQAKAEAEPEPATKEDMPKKKLLMLCSIESLNRQATKRQENAFTILKARKLAYEVVDATDPVNQTWREELFQLAEGVREYPLFFLLDLTDGETTFWGNFERFEYANDQGTLIDELTGKNTTAWDPTMFVEPEAPPSQPANGSSHTTVSAAEKDRLMEMFSKQLKRVEENHQTELAEIEKRHAQALKDAVASVKHDEVAERQRIEAKLTGESQKLHDRLSDVLKTNEGYKLKIDVLKREVAGMQQLLEHRDTDLGKASAVHKRDIKVLQEQLLEREEKASKAKQEAEKAEAARKASTEELEKTQREYTELKDKAQAIATELKERRVECNHLRHQADEILETKEKLEQTVENLTLQLSNHNISKSEKDGEMDRLRSELDEAKSTIASLQTEMQTKESSAEKALNDYKKKAQNSLAMANSRTASAVEAKEEAELEARAARSTADSAMERAVKAEISSKEAVAEAKAYVAEMEKSTGKAKSELVRATGDMETYKAKALELQNAVDELTGEKNKLVTDLAHAHGRLEEEQGRARALKDDSDRYKQQVHTAREEVNKLRQQVRRLETSNSDLEESKEASRQAHRTETHHDRDDATISMLQRQLAEANAVIEDLKSALNNAAEKHEATSHAESHAAEGNGTRGSAPLFYAMEKQAELKTAQNEINRLANLLADVQTEKMEAVEAKEDMRQLMEDAQAKLQRYQKLSNAPPAEESQKGLEPMPQNSGATNIEYLKNIMMRYLSAKTIAEKKALIPVIAAVLCLTPEEQHGAIKTLDDSASIKSVGNNLFESFSGRYF